VFLCFLIRSIYRSVGSGSFKEVKNFLRNRAVKLKVNIPKISVKEILIKTLKIVEVQNEKWKPTNTATLFFGIDLKSVIKKIPLRKGMVVIDYGCDSEGGEE